ncbi:hypothetical protein SLA2020_282970 [Shorea laevis]
MDQENSNKAALQLPRATIQHLLGLRLEDVVHVDRRESRQGGDVRAHLEFELGHVEDRMDPSLRWKIKLIRHHPTCQTTVNGP